MQPRRIRWSRLVIVAVSLLGLLSLCLIVVVLLAPNVRHIFQVPYWKTDPQRAALAAHKMFDYELPPGYEESRVLTIRDEDAAVIIAHRERPENMIYVEGVIDDIITNDEWRARYETRLAREMGGGRYDTKTVSTEQAVVRGQPTMLRFLEGTDKNGRPVRQVVCAFSGQDSDILLGIVAGQDTWDQAAVDAFLLSIR